MSTNITKFNTWTEGNTDTLQFQTAHPKTLRQYKFVKKKKHLLPTSTSKFRNQSKRKGNEVFSDSYCTVPVTTYGQTPV